MGGPWFRRRSSLNRWIHSGAVSVVIVGSFSRLPLLLLSYFIRLRNVILQAPTKDENRENYILEAIELPPPPRPAVVRVTTRRKTAPLAAYSIKPPAAVLAWLESIWPARYSRATGLQCPGVIDVYGDETESAAKQVNACESAPPLYSQKFNLLLTIRAQSVTVNGLWFIFLDPK